MITDYIFEYNSELLYENGEDEIVTLSSQLKYQLVNMDGEKEIDSKNNLLIQVYINNNDLECMVTDLKTSDIVAKTLGFIGYRVDDNIMYLYTHDKIEEVVLSK